MSDPSYKLPDEWVEVFHKAREDVIEECARVAETWYENHHPVHCDEIAAAIRALKDKP